MTQPEPADASPFWGLIFGVLQRKSQKCGPFSFQQHQEMFSRVSFWEVNVPFGRMFPVALAKRAWLSDGKAKGRR